MKTVKLTISGRVQGVCFRLETKDLAKKLNLKGYIRNTPKRNVEIIAQGSETAINTLIEFCKKGPKMAHVQKIDIEKQETQDFNSFKII